MMSSMTHPMPSSGRRSEPPQLRHWLLFQLGISFAAWAVLGSIIHYAV